MTYAEYLAVEESAEAAFSEEVGQSLMRLSSAVESANGNAQGSANDYFSQYLADSLGAYSTYEGRESQAFSSLWLAVENATAGLVGNFDIAAQYCPVKVASPRRICLHLR